MHAVIYLCAQKWKASKNNKLIWRRSLLATLQEYFHFYALSGVYIYIFVCSKSDESSQKNHSPRLTFIYKHKMFIYSSLQSHFVGNKHHGTKNVNDGKVIINFNLLYFRYRLLHIFQFIYLVLTAMELIKTI